MRIISNRIGRDLSQEVTNEPVKATLVVVHRAPLVQENDRAQMEERIREALSRGLCDVSAFQGMTISREGSERTQA